MTLYNPLIIIGLLSAMLSLPTLAKPDDAAIRQVVVDMNQAVSENNLPKLLAVFDRGALRIDLFPAHNYANTAQANEKPPVSSSDLAQRWQTVAALLFSTAKNYQRQVKDIKIQVDGRMATAWVDIETSMVAQDPKIKTRSNRFIEVLLLRRQNQQWKIAAVANNRSDQ